MKSTVSSLSLLLSFLLPSVYPAVLPDLPSWQHPRWQSPRFGSWDHGMPAKASQGEHKHPLTAQTSSGHVTGFVNVSYPDVRQFLGIQFGQAPVGKLRFAPPERVHAPESKIQATTEPSACPQIPSVGKNVFTVSAPAFLNHQPWDENCLFLNVFAPFNKSEEKLPVIIWLHGEGLQMGSVSVPYQQPQPWIQRTQKHIVVEVQYRLNVFGFPNAPGLRTNLGLLDQRLGMEWVRDNIVAFGGDPDRMILWGQSSGAGSVDGQNFAYPHDPIVQGFISDSGSVLFPPGSGFATIDYNHSNFTTVADGLGCPNRSDASEQVKCMREKPAKEIINFLADYSDNMTMPMLNFIATPDEIVVFSNYTERYAKGLLSKKPAIFGSNANEGVVMVPFPTNAATTAPNLTLANEATLQLFQCPAYASGLLRQKAGRQTYQYYYNGNFTNVSPLFWEGAYHMSELPQVFGTRGIMGDVPTEYEVTVSNAMQDMWLAFAEDPENASKAGWEKFSDGKLVVLGEAGSPVQAVEESKINGACGQLLAMQS